jgi:hypothetical protein
MLLGQEREDWLEKRLAEQECGSDGDRSVDTYRLPRRLLKRLSGYAHDCHVSRNRAVVEAVLDWCEKIECEKERRDRQRYPRLYRQQPETLVMPPVAEGSPGWTDRAAE